MKRDAIEMQYLLGKLSESEAQRLEERYFADDAVFDDIEIAEDELIDAYVRNQLSAEDRKQFELKLLSSKRIAERVEFAKLLSTSGFALPADDEPKKAGWWASLFNASWVPNSAFSGALAGVILLIVLGIPGSIAWMRLRNESKRLDNERIALEQQKRLLDQEADRQSRLTNDLKNANEQQDRREQELQAREEQLAKQSRQPTISTLASILLFPNSSPRSAGQPKELIVPSSASNIRLELVLEPNDYDSYKAVIGPSPGENVFAQEGLKQRSSGKARIIVWQIPSRLIKSGTYFVQVSGLTPAGTYDDVADYRLRISKK